MEEDVKKQNIEDQFPRPPDRLAGHFSAGFYGKKLVPTQRPIYQRMKLIYSELPVSTKVLQREASLVLKDNPGSDDEESRGTISKEMTALLGIRGLCMLRTIQREIALSIAGGDYWVLDGIGAVFIYDVNRALGSLYSHRGGKRSFRKRSRDQHDRLLQLFTSDTLNFECRQIISDGKRTWEIKTSGPPFKILRESEVSQFTEDHEEITEGCSHRRILLYVPLEAMELFTMGGKYYRAWGDNFFLQINRAVKHPHGTLAQDFIEEQLNTGWSHYGGTGKWSLDRILGELGLKKHYLYVDGNPDFPKTRPESNRWIRKFIRDLDWVSQSKRKRGLWMLARMKDPVFHQEYIEIGDFLQWLKTSEGKKALRIRRKGKEGALRFMLQVEVGSNHQLRKKRYPLNNRQIKNKRAPPPS